MISNMRPAHGVTVVVILACALGLAVHYIITPLPPPSPSDSIPTHAPARLNVSGAPLSSEPRFLTQTALSSDLSESSSGEGADSSILLERRCLAIAERDPLAAMIMAADNHLQEVDSALSTSLVAQWAAQDFERAYEWTKAQEPGPWRDDMLARLAYLRAPADPKAAARLVAVDMASGPAQDEAAISVIHQWALKDVQGAASWAQSLPDEALRQRAFDEIAGLAATSFPRKRAR
jgi:hypothetical protein